MADLTLNEKFQKLTGINVIDIEEFISNAENPTEAFKKLQYWIPRGKYTDASLIHEGDDLKTNEKVKIFAEVMTEVANKCGISSSESDIENIDLNSNSVTDSEDKAAQSGLSEAYAILNGYDSEDDDDTSSN